MGASLISIHQCYFIPLPLLILLDLHSFRRPLITPNFQWVTTSFSPVDISTISYRWNARVKRILYHIRQGLYFTCQNSSIGNLVTQSVIFKAVQDSSIGDLVSGWFFISASSEHCRAAENRSFQSVGPFRVKRTCLWGVATANLIINTEDPI